jgi:hypothetical protein
MLYYRGLIKAATKMLVFSQRLTAAVTELRGRSIKQMDFLTTKTSTKEKFVVSIVISSYASGIKKILQDTTNPV